MNNRGKFYRGRLNLYTYPFKFVFKAKLGTVGISKSLRVRLAIEL